MALTTPFAEYYTPTSDADLIKKIFDELSTFGWTIKDCYDGTLREQPTGGLQSNLTNEWKVGGTLVSGAWAVVTSMGGAVSAQFDMYIRVDSTSSIYFRMVSLGDFSAGAGPDSSPTLPSTTLAIAQTHVTGTAVPRSIVLDEGMLAIVPHNKGSTSQTCVYIGEVNPLQPLTTDPRPFVSYSGSLWEGTSWVRLALNNVNKTLQGWILFAFSQVLEDVDAANGALFHLMSPGPMVVTTASYKHHVGYPRHIAIGPDIFPNDTSYTGSIVSGAKEWCFFRAVFGQSSAAIRHDGTALDTDLSITKMGNDIDPPVTSCDPPDVTKPVINNVAPLTLSSLESVDPVSFDITDDSGNFLVSFITALYPSTGEHEVVYNGDEFSSRFKATSSKAAITDGHHWIIKRVGGWPSAVTLKIKVYDLAGNQAVLTVS